MFHSYTSVSSVCCVIRYHIVTIAYSLVPVTSLSRRGQTAAVFIFPVIETMQRTGWHHLLALSRRPTVHIREINGVCGVV